MEYSLVNTLQWANAEHTAINCFVSFSGYGDVPFTASANDSTTYGPKIFAECVAGMYGEIAEYVPLPAPVIPTVTGTQTL